MSDSSSRAATVAPGQPGYDLVGKTISFGPASGDPSDANRGTLRIVGATLADGGRTIVLEEGERDRGAGACSERHWGQW